MTSFHSVISPAAVAGIFRGRVRPTNILHYNPAFPVNLPFPQWKKKHFTWESGKQWTTNGKSLRAFLRKIMASMSFWKYNVAFTNALQPLLLISPDVTFSHKEEGGRRKREMVTYWAFQYLCQKLRKHQLFFNQYDFCLPLHDNCPILSKNVMQIG